MKFLQDFRQVNQVAFKIYNLILLFFLSKVLDIGIYVGRQIFEQQ